MTGAAIPQATDHLYTSLRRKAERRQSAPACRGNAARQLDARARDGFARNRSDHRPCGRRSPSTSGWRGSRTSMHVHAARRRAVRRQQPRHARRRAVRLARSRAIPGTRHARLHRRCVRARSRSNASTTAASGSRHQGTCRRAARDRLETLVHSSRFLRPTASRNYCAARADPPPRQPRVRVRACRSSTARCPGRAPASPTTIPPKRAELAAAPAAGIADAQRGTRWLHLREPGCLESRRLPHPVSADPRGQFETPLCCWPNSTGAAPVRRQRPLANRPNSCETTARCTTTTRPRCARAPRRVWRCGRAPTGDICAGAAHALGLLVRDIAALQKDQRAASANARRCKPGRRHPRDHHAVAVPIQRRRARKKRARMATTRQAARPLRLCVITTQGAEVCGSLTPTCSPAALPPARGRPGSNSWLPRQQRVSSREELGDWHGYVTLPSDFRPLGDPWDSVLAARAATNDGGCNPDVRSPRSACRARPNPTPASAMRCGADAQLVTTATSRRRCLAPLVSMLLHRRVQGAVTGGSSLVFRNTRSSRRRRRAARAPARRSTSNGAPVRQCGEQCQQIRRPESEKLWWRGRGLA